MTLWYCASNRSGTRAPLFVVLRLKQGCNFAAHFEVLRLKIQSRFCQEPSLLTVMRSAFFATKQLRKPRLATGSRGCRR